MTDATDFRDPHLGRYLTDAVDELKRHARTIKDPAKKRYAEGLARLAQRGIKFTLPYSPTFPMDDVLETHEFKPPYPITTFEIGLAPSRDDWPTYQSVLIIIALDEGDHVRLWYMGGWRDGTTWSWLAPGFSALFVYDPELSLYNSRGMPKAVVEYFGDDDEAEAEIAKQARPLSHIYAAICYALSRYNTSTVDVVPDAKENRMRRARGKAPLFTHKTLTIGEPKAKTTSRKGGGTHASPRSHLRRGHYRTSKNGIRYWVSASFVNGGTPGFVHKDYELKLGAQNDD